MAKPLSFFDHRKVQGSSTSVENTNKQKGPCFVLWLRKDVNAHFHNSPKSRLYVYVASQCLKHVSFPRLTISVMPP